MQIINWDSLAWNLKNNDVAAIANQFLYDDGHFNYGNTGPSLVEGYIVYGFLLDAIEFWCMQEGVDDNDLVTGVPLRLCDEDVWVAFTSGHVAL